MSLFKARDWWHAQCGSGEEFDTGCLCVGNIDNDPMGYVKLATGSFSGMLRVYLPKDRDFKAEDLLLEQELDQAILQLEAGRFSAQGNTQLAVLHPRKLSVYSLQAMGGAYLQLTRLYEHALEHTAANMTMGSFGGVQGQDYICVQSYDGQLSFFECEAYAFSRFLPNYVIPGPLCYVEQSDSFVTCSSSFELESYKYKVLAAASGDKAAAQGAQQPGISVAKRLQADWKVVLGEAAVSIRCGRLSSGSGQQPQPSDIVVLCEHTVFVVSASGHITFQKRLEYHPACCCTYAVPGAATKIPGGPENLLVTTHTKALLVYRSNVLCWSARMDFQPIAVAVADLGGNGMTAQRGMVVGLDDTGRLGVCYLGTDPMLNPVGFVEGKDLDYEAMAKEHRALAAVIREHSGGKRVEPLDKLIMRAQVPLMFDSARAGGPSDMGGGSNPRSASRRLTVKLYMVYQGSGSSVENVTVTVRAPQPVTVDSDTIVVPTVRADPTDPTLATITFAAGASCLPASNTAIISAAFTAANGEPRAQSIEVELPLCLFAAVVQPVKNAGFKVTVGLNRAPPSSITSLFEDMTAQAGPGMAQALAASGAGANVLSFQFYNGAECTIVVSKNGGRYRLQSDSLDAMWLVLHELVKRLVSYYELTEGGAPVPEGKLAVTYDEPIPLEDFFEAVQAHFDARQRAAETKKLLEDRAVQFRAIERRLLMRFKDKNPSPLNQLDFLMEETYHEIMESGTALDSAQAAVKGAAGRLAGVVQLMLQLIRYKFAVTPAEYSVLRSYLTPEVTDSGEIGWEEMTEASMTQLLRSALAKNAKEAAVPLPPLAQAKDTSRLRKHVSLVLERLAKGMRLALEADDLEAPGGSGGGPQQPAGGPSGGRARPARVMSKQGSGRSAGL